MSHLLLLRQTQLARPKASATLKNKTCRQEAAATRRKTPENARVETTERKLKTATRKLKTAQVGVTTFQAGINSEAQDAGTLCKDAVTTAEAQAVAQALAQAEAQAEAQALAQAEAQAEAQAVAQAEVLAEDEGRHVVARVLRSRNLRLLGAAGVAGCCKHPNAQAQIAAKPVVVIKNTARRS
jgi:hypothetical protein